MLTSVAKGKVMWAYLTEFGANEIVPIDFSKLTMTTDDDSSSATANATATAGK